MPELPEVETIVTRLKSELVNEVIQKIEVRREKSFGGDCKKLAGRKILNVRRRAKLIVIDLEKDHLLVHLKMTGQLILVDGKTRVGGGHPTADWVKSLPSSHTRVIIWLKSGKVLYFNDQRVFGWVRLMSDEELALELEKYAPDIIDPLITSDYLFEKLQKRSSAIKLVVLDSKVVAGIGNIYACDGLFLAGIDPQKPARDLRINQIKKLLDSLRVVINRGIKLGGATIDTYRNVDGLSGGYQDVVLVYGKEGQPCPTCGAKIERFKQGGRSTLWCPFCQSQKK